jgi:SAM-dependent methyltransferase
VLEVTVERMTSPTIDYYDRNADDFMRRTAVYDQSAIYDAFASMVPAGSHILDAGCGPGRDMIEFRRRGYEVTGLDASAAMVKLAAARTGRVVHHLSFEAIEFDEVFDAIWSNASLLHVPRAGMDRVMRRLARALKPGGAWYMSFRIGDGERSNHDARLFNDYTVDALRDLLTRVQGVQLIRTWETPETNPTVEPRPWLHALVRKSG